MLNDAHFMSIADRSILACWGVKGGKVGRPFEVTIDLRRPRRRRRRRDQGRRGDPDPHPWPRLGDLLERDPALVVRDVVWEKVSAAAA